MKRKDSNSICPCTLIGFLHRITLSNYPLDYDLCELFRYVVDSFIIQTFESGSKNSNFITTEKYYIQLKFETAKNLVGKIYLYFNK